MTARCVRCGRFMGEYCKYCDAVVMRILDSVVGMGILATILRNPNLGQEIAEFKAIFQRVIAESQERDDNVTHGQS